LEHKLTVPNQTCYVYKS